MCEKRSFSSKFNLNGERLFPARRSFHDNPLLLISRFLRVEPKRAQFSEAWQRVLTASGRVEFRVLLLCLNSHWLTLDLLGTG